MRPGATFIITARGAVVDEAGVLGVLGRQPDSQALLDVTEPEPPVVDLPLCRLDNAHLTSHVAGSINRETRRLGRHGVEQFQA